MPSSVCVIGSINADLVVHADRLPQPGETVLGGRFSVHDGGKGANAAVAAARAGAQVTPVHGPVPGEALLETYVWLLYSLPSGGSGPMGPVGADRTGSPRWRAALPPAEVLKPPALFISGLIFHVNVPG